MKMMRNIPKQMHLFVILVMLGLAALRMVGILLANYSLIG
jgi:hypothetical protein